MARTNKEAKSNKRYQKMRRSDDGEERKKKKKKLETRASVRVPRGIMDERVLVSSSS